MMINIYSIYDSAAKAFLQPFFMAADGQALRAFQDNVNSDEESIIKKHPEQFTLFKIGTFDDQTGTITADQKQEMGNGLAYVIPKPVDELQVTMTRLIDKLNLMEE